MMGLTLIGPYKEEIFDWRHYMDTMKLSVTGIPSDTTLMRLSVYIRDWAAFNMTCVILCIFIH